MSRKQKSLHVTDPVEVGLRIRAARIQAGLSQAVLAGERLLGGVHLAGSSWAIARRRFSSSGSSPGAST